MCASLTMYHVLREYNSDSSRGYCIIARYRFENSPYVVYGRHKSHNRSVLESQVQW